MFHSYDILNLEEEKKQKKIEEKAAAWDCE